MQPAVYTCFIQLMMEDEYEIITLKEKEKKGSKRKAKSFKDEEYFISSVPTNHHTEAGLSVRVKDDFNSNRLEAAILDLVADDNVGMKREKSVYHWDKRGKKYIKLNNGERVTASGKIKTESGAKAKLEKTGLYKKWKECSHNKVSLKGSTSEGNAEEATGNHRWQGQKGKFRGGKRQQSVPNAHVRLEIKDLEQVRKERQKKADRISYIKSKSTKGKKFGKKGNGKARR